MEASTENRSSRKKRMKKDMGFRTGILFAHGALNLFFFGPPFSRSVRSLLLHIAVRIDQSSGKNFISSAFAR